MKSIATNVIIFISLLVLPMLGDAQNEGNFWYFGTNAGIDFNSGTAVAVTNGQLITQEGCATISDNSGNLLFYTDGIFVWNSNHLIMPNGFGLLGDPSSTQSAIIVKKPGSNLIYYIFTVDNEGQANGLRYSEVDMSLQGGLGDINISKNILIATPVCEKICAIKHQNNTDFWIVTHLYNGSNTYHSYLLSSTGLNITPIVTNIGINIPFVATGAETLGYLRASPDGTRIVAANWTEDNFDLYDFNKTTGVLSNVMSFTGFNGSGAFPTYGGPYGVEFSPNGNLLYIAENYLTINNVYQYNLLAGSFAAINSSRITIATATPGLSGALQLAPDQKIYHALWGELAVSVINNPNILGLGCNYATNAFSLAGKTSGIGFPTFVNSINPAPGFSFINLCFGDSTQFNINSTLLLDSVLWDFGDPGSGINNTSGDTIPIHFFTGTGSYTVTLITYSPSGSDTTVNQVTITPLPIINLGNDTLICPGDLLILNATTPNANYLWSDNSTNPTLNVSIPGTYWVQVSVNNCSSTDTLIVIQDTLSNINLGNDMVLCEGETLLLNATTPNGNYLWQDNSTNSTLIVNSQGNYWVEVTNNCGTTSDTINILIDTCTTIPLVINIVMPNVITPNNDGENDLFIPIIMEGIQNADITIFNRWGLKLYESNNITLGWDGKCSGDNCSDGTYFWIVNYTSINSEKGTLKGSVSLLK